MSRRSSAPTAASCKARPASPASSLLTSAQLRAARAGPVRLDSTLPAGVGDGHWRLLARPVSRAPAARVAVVAASLEPRAVALRHLMAQLLIGGAAALLLASIGAYALAAAALRPVVAMSRKAAEISLRGDDRRLPVPPTNDEIAKLGARLNEMLARIEEAFGHERRFLADASHELRTPLAILRTELELAARRPRSREELEAVVASAREEVDRLGQLAEDLLVVASFDQGGPPLEVRRVSAAGLLEEVADRFEQRAAEQGRRVVADAPDGLDVVCDPVRIGQALANLVDNALHYGAGDVQVTATRCDGLVELHVRDSGRGFPEAFLPRAFERFSRADEVRAAPGTGLGLAIVQAIAEAHGGDASVVNRSGGGADAVVRLPRSG